MELNRARPWNQQLYKYSKAAAETKEEKAEEPEKATRGGAARKLSSWLLNSISRLAALVIRSANDSLFVRRPNKTRSRTVPIDFSSFLASFLLLRVSLNPSGERMRCECLAGWLAGWRR